MNFQLNGKLPKLHTTNKLFEYAKHQWGVWQEGSLTFRTVEARVLRDKYCMLKVTKLRIEEQCLRTSKQYGLRKVITSNRRKLSLQYFTMGWKVNNAKNTSLVTYLCIHIFQLSTFAVIPDNCSKDIAWYPRLISRKILVKITSCSFKPSPRCTNGLLEVLPSMVWSLKVDWNGAIKQGERSEAKNLIKYLKMLSLCSLPRVVSQCIMQIKVYINITLSKDHT